MHTDRTSASGWLRRATGAPNAIGLKAVQVALLLREGEGPDGLADPARHFDRLIEDGETMALGELEIEAWWMPGHCASAMVFTVGDAAFVNDTLLSPTLGTSRADAPGASAEELWTSARGILSFDPGLRTFSGWSADASARSAGAWHSTVAEQRQGNVDVGDGASEADFVASKRSRDARTPPPRSTVERMRLNLRAGDPAIG